MRYAVIAVLLSGLLTASQSVAHGGGGSGGGHGGGGFHASVSVRTGHVNSVVRRTNNIARKSLAFQHFPNGINRFNNRFNNGFAGGYGWPVGDWWPDSGYAYQPVQAAPEPAPAPQVIVIHSDGDGHMRTAEAAPDVSYVKGCHAIPNGYHCDVP